MRDMQTMSYVQIKTGGYGIRPYGKVCRNRERSTSQYYKFFAKLSAKESGGFQGKALTVCALFNIRRMPYVFLFYDTFFT